MTVNVTLKGLANDFDKVTYNLVSTITSADIGKAVTIDTDAANRVKLAGDGDYILGRLFSVENHQQFAGGSIGTVDQSGSMGFPVKTGLTGDDVVAVGKQLVGAGAGEVKAAAADAITVATTFDDPDYVSVVTKTGFLPIKWLVFEVSGTEAVARKL